MSLFNRIDYVLFVRSHQLEIFSLSSAQVFKIDFPDVILKYQEIRNREKFEELVVNLIKKEKLFNKKAIIILSDEIVFEKVIIDSEVAKNPDLIKSIFDEIPLTYEELGKKIFVSKSEMKVWGTNQMIFKVIKSIMEANGWNIKAVVPLNAFSKYTNQKELKISAFQEIINDQKYIDKINFLNDDTIKNRKKNNFFPIFLLIIFVIFLFYYFNGYKYITKLHLINNSNSTVSKIKPTSIKLPTPTKKIFATKDYKIIILNGSKREGEASVLQKKLQENGFTIEEIDNADRSDYEQTKILSSKEISMEYLVKLKDFLNKTYEVEDKIATAVPGIDIQIIIGKNTR